MDARSPVATCLLLLGSCGPGDVTRTTEGDAPSSAAQPSVAPSAAPSLTAGPAGPFTLTSPAFDGVAHCSEQDPVPCDVIPDEHTGYMGNPDVSPELRWSGVPANTRSFAITLFDLTFGQPHWVIWNVPGNATLLPANVEEGTTTPTTPAGSRQSSATFAPRVGYFGPQSPCNVFQFEIFALSLEAFSPTEPEYAALVKTELEALGDAVLGRATLNARTNPQGTCD